MPARDSLPPPLAVCGDSARRFAVCRQPAQHEPGTAAWGKGPAMARKTARVEQDTLVSGLDAGVPLTVGTPAWFAWLERATTFSFSGPTGSFTARKEARARGGGYWKAYRTAHGTQERIYLGKSADLTLARLQEAAATLATALASPRP